MKKVLFIMGLHSHQPVGNFDWVFEDAWRDCYHPFLEVLARYPKIRMTLHYSGVLLEWIRRHHPETFDLLRRLVESGQVEMMGGGFDEPILVMIPDGDKVGQITMQTEYLKEHFGVKPRGLWLAERVWEQSLVGPIAEAGIEYVPVDDSHFRFAGIDRARFDGYFITEDRGRTLNVFPMDEKLRYYVPFQDPEKTIEYLRGVATEDGTAVMTYADDGEKFGSWPGTHKHVYLDPSDPDGASGSRRGGWLERFFNLLVANSDWIEIVTFAEALDRVHPKGRVFLPDASYREMMEWVLPVTSQTQYEDLVGDIKDRGLWDRARFFLKGGTWRSFRVKYPEANDMYAKMMWVSEKVARLTESNGRYGAARDELYQGQCNCSYWHGVFGGLYLPHLRFAIYKHLIAAENIADAELKGKGDWCDSQVVDYNFDRRSEVILSSPHLSLYLVPHRGGHLVELDVRAKTFNPLAVLSRRAEAYHRKVLERHAKGASESDVASIHDKVIFKREGLETMLQYDRTKREGLIDHVLPFDLTPEAFERNEYEDLGDFVEGEYAFEVSKRRSAQHVTLTRHGSVGGTPVTVRKTVTLGATQPTFTVDYEIAGPDDRAVSFIFAIEMPYAMLAAHADDRWYYREERDVKLGELATRLNEAQVTRFGLVDGWQQLDIALAFSEPANVWTFPLETVSQSESGFEAVYQASIVLARWGVDLEPGERWKLKFEQSHAAIG